MAKIKEVLDFISERANNNKYIYVKDEVVWHWDILIAILMVIILFPTWIREVSYKRIKNNNYKKEDD